MKRICETCKDNKFQGCINVETIVAFDKVDNFWDYIEGVGCSNWKPKKRGTCGECEWFDYEGNQREALWTTRYEPDKYKEEEINEAKSKGACLVHAPKGAYWFPAVAKDQKGCGQWMPKDES